MEGDQFNPDSEQSGIIPISDQIDLSSIQAELDSLPSKSNGFDVEIYLPPGVQVEFVEKGTGALFTPHRINEFSIKVVKHKVALIVFQCILRYSLGYNRPTARLSNTFIAKWAGLHTPNVRKGLKELKQMGLIQVVVQGSYSKITVYDVPIIRGYLDWKNQKDGGSKQSHPNDQIGSFQSPVRIETNLQVDSFRSLTNKNTKKKTNTTLRTELPFKLQDYISTLKPHRQRVDEEYFLNQLIKDYQPDQIEEAFDYVRGHGTVDTQEPVHSPLKYLSYTIETVLSEIKTKKDKLRRAEQLRRETEEKQRREEVQKQRDAQELRQALDKFESSLSEDEQNTYLNSYYTQNFGSNSFMPKNLIKRIAVKDWYQRQAQT